jgi:cytochrome c-type biogenesis protein CcmH/NrfF
VIVSQQPIVDPSREAEFVQGPPPLLMSVQRAWVVVAVYVLVLGGISLVRYQRRDVT